MTDSRILAISMQRLCYECRKFDFYLTSTRLVHYNSELLKCNALFRVVLIKELATKPSIPLVMKCFHIPANMMKYIRVPYSRARLPLTVYRFLRKIAPSQAN